MTANGSRHGVLTVVSVARRTIRHARRRVIIARKSSKRGTPRPVVGRAQAAIGRMDPKTRLDLLCDIRSQVLRQENRATLLIARGNVRSASVENDTGSINVKFGSVGGVRRTLCL